MRISFHAKFFVCQFFHNTKKMCIMKQLHELVLFILLVHDLLKSLPPPTACYICTFLAFHIGSTSYMDSQVLVPDLGAPFITRHPLPIISHSLLSPSLHKYVQHDTTVFSFVSSLLLGLSLLQKDSHMVSSSLIPLETFSSETLICSLEFSATRQPQVFTF